MIPQDFDIIPRSPRIQEDSATRLLKQYQSYLNSPLSFDIIKETKLIVAERFRNLGVWTDYCLFPFGFWLLAQKNPSIDADNTITSYLLSQWNLSKNIYKFDKDFLDLLPKIPLDNHPAVSVLKSLPEWCIYVETPDWNLLGLTPNGYFACLDWHPEDGILLRILLDITGYPWSCDIAIDHKYSFKDIINEELTHKLQNLCESPNGCETLKINRRDLFVESIRTIIPQLYAICAKNADIVNITHPSQPLRRSTFGGNPKGGPKLLANKKPSLLIVGGSLVKKSKDAVRFEYSNQSGKLEIELDHPGVLSTRQLSEKETKENSLIALIHQTLDHSKSNIKLLETTIEELRASNEELTEEGLRYLSDLQSLQDEYTKQQNEIIRLSYLKNHKAQASLSYQHEQYDNNAEPIPIAILDKFISGRDLSATEALRFVERALGNRLHILPDAWMSAKEIDSSKSCGRKLVTLIFKLATEYLDIYLTKGDSEAKKVFGSIYAAKESDSVMNSQLNKSRVFSGIEMTQHIKVNYSIRLYFCVNADTHRILIGYCGKHLQITSR